MCAGTLGASPARSLTLELQRRDPVSGAATTSHETVDPKRVGLVVVDMWNWHWCKTSTERVSALVPRLNACLREARDLGMPVFLCPTDVADNYVGTPMVERVLAVEPMVPPQGPEPVCPPAPDGGGCTCGKERCQGNYGWDGMHPDLEIGPDDLMPNDPDRLYTLCRQRGITHLVFCGVHTQVCLLGKSIGLRAMSRAGFHCALARDLTDAHGRYEPGVETPDDFTAKVVEHFEKHLAATVDLAATLRRHGAWKETNPVDFVRHSPWGTPRRPHLFESSLTVTLTNPMQPGAEIRYTLDGAEPSASSARYDAPLQFERPVRIKAAAFRNGHRVTRVSESLAVRLGAIPPAPDVRLGDLTPWRAVGMGHSPALNEHRFSPGVQPPQRDTTNEGKPIVLRGQTYAHGLGVHAPSQVIYDLKPEWTRFTARAGVDEQVLAVGHGTNRAMHPSVVFRVFIDGTLAAESPMMRISFEPWRFDVPIPPGSKRLSLAATDGGDGHYMDLANWADAGFVVAATAATPHPSAAEALRPFTVDDGLEVERVAAEPDVAQPVSLTFDERGRMWVVQYRQYPFPAGLKVVGHDEYWRVKYDAFPPPPPPHHTPGADKVTIFEDRDGDGRFEAHRDFVTGLNITTAALPGKDGVWIMNPPYLLFYPDANHDDTPDGDPVVHLAGFGLEDMHAVASSLTWGPDGWMYGCQGSTCTATVTRPGINEPGLHFDGQAIWRYHPATRRFELFAEGGWNNFAIAVDEKWRLFTGSNGGIIGVHYVQGGYYRKHFPKHGPFTNPFTFGHVEGMTDHSSKAKLSQAMTFCAADGWPANYRNGVLVARVLQQRIDLCEFLPEGSSYSAHERRPALSSSDPNFRPVDLKLGPDGAAYIADWHEPNVTWNVTAGEGGLNPGTGRIYRLKPKGLAPAGKIDFTALTGPQLLEKLRHPNQWHRETAQRQLRDRRDASLVPTLTTLMEHADAQTALESVWALHACGGFTEAAALRALRHPDAMVRAWTIRLLADDRTTSEGVAKSLVGLARTEPHPQVRSQLACSARRLPAATALPVTANLAQHLEDASDPNIPLLLWYVVEDKLRTERETTLHWLEASPLWEAPLFRSALVSRLGQRFTTERSPENLKLCARLLAVAPRLEEKRELLRGMATGLAGDTVDSIPPELEAAFGPLWAAGPPDAGLILVAARLGSREAATLAVGALTRADTTEADRITLLRLLAERRDPRAREPALALLRDASTPALRQEALAAVQAFGTDDVGQAVLAQALSHEAAWRNACLTVLSSRPSWAALVLQAVEDGTLNAAQVPRDVVRSLLAVVGEEHKDRITKHWGTLNQTPESKQKRITELASQLAEAQGDPAAGRQTFALLCGTCHSLHGEGRVVGPDLTGIDRGDRGALLHSIVDPSASVLPDFMAFEVKLQARPGEEPRQIIGFIHDETANGLDITDVAGTRTSVATGDIAERNALPISIMPEGLLDALSAKQVRDLFAWLQSTPAK